MTPGFWKTPNFRVTIAEGERSRSFPMYAASRGELIRRLESKGWVIRGVEPYDFKTWLERAQGILENLLNASTRTARSEIFDKSPLWGMLKEHLFDLFHGKCAYCEWKPRGGSYGDVDHFRPKSEVAGEEDHTGYFWLAFCPMNLLPSCEICNRGGKRTRFPVEEGTRALLPEQVSGERPLLLYPYGLEDCREHIRFVRGRPEGLTDKGRAFIATLRLDRGSLTEPRYEAQKAVERDWAARMHTMGAVEAYKGLRDELTSGRREFAAAALQELERIMTNLIREYQDESGS